MNFNKELSNIIRSHKIMIKPIRNSINTKYQLELFDSSPEIYPNIVMGWFYELITGAFWGGKVLAQTPYYYADLNHDELMAKPDVVSKRSFMESKACRNGHSLNLYDRQIEKYISLQCLHPNRTVFFSIYRHRFKKIYSYRGSESYLVELLCAKTMLNIIIPLSIILEAFNNTEVMYRFEGTEYGDLPRTVMRSSFINLFAFDPAKAVKTLGLSPDKYQIYRFLSPKEFEVNETILSQFPIVVIEDADHISWVTKFKEKKKERIPF